ncbi:DUF4253 domain-containing protein [Kribbella sp. CA-253562]|uniref:DUF4253 domain-containing protein n=1 Tax=Kribbella sp. CA-253562 TaxID=3239942 RepID=UPI003D8DE9B7
MRLAACPDLPPLVELGTAWSGAEVRGFASSGQSAVEQWTRLHAARAETGLHPILLPPDFLAISEPARSAAEVIAAADQLDGALILADRQAYQDRLLSAATELPAAPGSRSKSPAPTAEAGQSEDDRFGPPADFEMWEDDYPGPRGRDILRLANGCEFHDDGTVTPVAYTVMVALIECAEPWHVFAHLGFDNEALRVDEHVAVLRHLFETYQAVPATLTMTDLELVLGKPPATDEEAMVAAGLYLAYNDGAYDNYLSSSQQNLAGKLKDNSVWSAWWD